MEYPRSIMTQYYFRVKKSDSITLQSTKSIDLFQIHVTVKHIPSNSLTSSLLFQSEIFTRCEDFFGDNQSFRRSLTNSIPYLTPDRVDFITQYIIPQVQELFPRRDNVSPQLDSKVEVVPLDLEIVLDEIDIEVIEELEDSMYLGTYNFENSVVYRWKSLMRKIMMMMPINVIFTLVLTHFFTSSK